jgi:single-stranded DNA-binding protein
MSVTITGKLNKAAHQFQAGESMGFGIRLGERYYDRETKQKEWTNYEFAVFAKNPDQIAFYQQALVEGAIVEVVGKQQKVKQYQGQNGLQVSIEILDASLGYVGGGMPQQAPQGGFNQAPQRQQPQGFNQQPQPQQFGQVPQQNNGRQGQGFGAPQQAPAGFDDFDDD